MTTACTTSNSSIVHSIKNMLDKRLERATNEDETYKPSKTSIDKTDSEKTEQTQMEVDDSDCDCSVTTETTASASIVSNSEHSMEEQFPPPPVVTSTMPEAITSHGKPCKIRNLISSKTIKNINNKRTKSQRSSSLGNSSHHQQHNDSSSSSLMHRQVHFAPGTLPEPLTKRRIKKRKQNETSCNGYQSCDSIRWWTRQELKAIQESCIFAVKTRHFLKASLSKSKVHRQTLTKAAQNILGDDMVLDRFSERHRKRRKLVRWQMVQTCKTVQNFEKATNIKTPPELLSQVLNLYSKPMENDAIESALQARKGATREDCTEHDDVLDPVATMVMLGSVHDRRSYPSTGLPSSPSKAAMLSGQIDVALACARTLMQRSMQASQQSQLQQQRQYQQQQQQQQHRLQIEHQSLQLKLEMQQQQRLQQMLHKQQEQLQRVMSHQQ